MKTTTAIWIGFLMTGLISYSIYSFLQNHEYVEQTITTEMRGEARSNPLFAGRLFLKRMGIGAQTVKLGNTETLPAVDTVILMQTERVNLSQQRNQELLEWVERGGHLIIRANPVDALNRKAVEQNEQSTDLLLATLGIRQMRPSVRVERSRVNTDLPANSTDGKLKHEQLPDKTTGNNTQQTNLFNLELKGINSQPYIKIRRFNPLELDAHNDADTEQIRIGGDTFIIRQNRGRGLITVLADMRFLHNAQLGKADHAQLLWYLVQRQVQNPRFRLQQPDAVWLVHSDTMPSLWQLIRQHFGALLLTLLLLALAWLLRVSGRFGPVIAKTGDNRRSLTEHIHSSGTYYWHHKQRSELVQSTRSVVLQALATHHAGWRQLDTERQCSLVAAQSNLSKEQVRQALFGVEPQQAESFIRLIQVLETIRQQHL